MIFCLCCPRNKIVFYIEKIFSPTEHIRVYDKIISLILGYAVHSGGTLGRIFLRCVQPILDIEGWVVS